MVRIYRLPLSTQKYKYSLTSVIAFCMINNVNITVCRGQYFQYLNLGIENYCILDNAVGTATCYGLDSPGIESRWRRDITHPSRTALELTQPPIQWVPGLSRG